MAETIDLQACERCSKEFPVGTMRMMDDCWFCEVCTADFDKTFNACEHQWEPHVDNMGDAGQCCTKCTGFVCNEDVHLLIKGSLQFPSQSWAVFNGHVNDASARALDICRKRFAGGSDLDELERFAHSGIMEIFHHQPNRVSKLYADLVFAFANGMTEEHGNAFIAARQAADEKARSI